METELGQTALALRDDIKPKLAEIQSEIASQTATLQGEIQAVATAIAGLDLSVTVNVGGGGGGVGGGAGLGRRRGEDDDLLVGDGLGSGRGDGGGTVLQPTKLVLTDETVIAELALDHMGEAADLRGV